LIGLGTRLRSTPIFGLQVFHLFNIPAAWCDCGNRQSEPNDANPHDRIVTAPDPSVFFDPMRASSA
jgi:hypothetical protein